LRAAKRRESFAGFSGDQRFKPGSNQSSLLLDAGEFPSALEQGFIDD